MGYPRSPYGGCYRRRLSRCGEWVDNMVCDGGCGAEVLPDGAGWKRVFSFDADSLPALSAPAAGQRGDALFACRRWGHGDAGGESRDCTVGCRGSAQYRWAPEARLRTDGGEAVD